MIIQAPVRNDSRKMKNFMGKVEFISVSQIYPNHSAAVFKPFVYLSTWFDNRDNWWQ